MKLNAITSSLTGATVAGPTGTPPAISVDFTANPNPGDKVKFTFNMPDGEIFTGPVEESVNGWVRFTYPANYGGVSVEGAELTFSNGRVESAKAGKNQDYLLKTLEIDPGARYLGGGADVGGVA